MARFASLPDAELQRKGDRNYFKEAIQLPADEIYASPIDFSQDEGKTEKPNIPTLRVAAPVIAPNGERFGILIVNIDMRPIFDQLRNAAREGDIFVVNEHGDYLVHPDLRREFGFEHGTPFRIQDDFPEFKELLAGDNSRRASSRTASATASGSVGIQSGWPVARASLS